jgi:hypothetical protein
LFPEPRKIKEFGKILEAILTLESYLEVKKLEAKKYYLSF